MQKEESKKLSELIDDFINTKKQYDFLCDNGKDVPTNVVTEIGKGLNKIKNQIDQKFEELRCGCFKVEINYCSDPSRNQRYAVSSLDIVPTQFPGGRGGDSGGSGHMCSAECEKTHR